jgi:hypothetical protein
LRRRISSRFTECEKTTVGLAKFVDATSEAGFATEPGPRDDAAVPVGLTASAAGDIDGDGTDDLFVSAWSASQRKSIAHLYRVQGGFVRDAGDRSGISLAQGASFATFADFDNDGWLDLFAIGGDGRGHLFRNRGDGTFADVTAKAGVTDVRGATRAVFVDLDHDGDLDLLLLGSAQRIVYRNNLDGTFSAAGAGGCGRERPPKRSSAT